MKHSVWLSLSVGAPVALLAVGLLFWLESNRVTSRPSSATLKLSAGIASLAIIVIAVGRFAAFR